MWLLGNLQYCSLHYISIKAMIVYGISVWWCLKIGMMEWEKLLTDLSTVRSHEESFVSNVLLLPTSTQPHLAVPVLLHHTSKYLFNISPHLLKQSIQTEFQSTSSCYYLISILKTDIKFAKFSFLTLLNSKWPVCWRSEWLGQFGMTSHFYPR